MAKYYGVRQGVKTGVFNNWNNCQEQVKGYKGAEYKSFTSKEEAEEYVFGKCEVIQEITNKFIKLNEEEIDEISFNLKAIKTIAETTGILTYTSDDMENVKLYISNVADLLKIKL